MSRIEDLIGTINDGALQVELLQEIERLKQRKDFGLVFERHHPESLLLGSAVGVHVGNQVRVRREPSNRTTYRVLEVDGEQATVEAVRTSKPSQPKPATGADGAAPEQREVALADLMVVQPFGQPIYPGLTTVDRVQRDEDRPFHAVINSENYHALQLLVHVCAGQVDCIYIDPPYNTGARDWKYDNDYVDSADRYQHSKWLSFMEKRLALAKRLLKPDGVLVCTIDENEVNHLGLLLEQEFPQARTQMVTICINPSGASGATGMSRVEEYAFFCFLGDARPVAVADDMLVSDADADVVHTSAEGVRWEWLMRGGNAWYRRSRPNLCYPIVLTEDGKRIVRAGAPWAPPFNDDGSEDESARPETIDGHPVAWPVRKDGKLGIWRVDSARLNWLAEHGYVYVSRRDDSRGTWTIKYLMAGTTDAIEAGVIDVTGRDPDTGRVTVAVRERRGKTVRTMWHRGRHNAGGGGGTQMLNALLGERDKFSYPKSVYATRDALEVAIGDRPDALIVDFFAGSGTTTQAVCLLNRADGGRRRSIVVTNNEVDAELADKLHKQDLFTGDRQFEANGIFEMVTLPRLKAAITGQRPDGQPVEGNYLDGKSYAEGFPENCEFLRLEYLDPDRVELGRAFEAIHPILWLRAGAASMRMDPPNPDVPYFLDAPSRHAVLFDEAAFADFAAELNDAGETIQTVFLVTDSEDAFAEMQESLGPGVHCSMLYRDYLRSFRIGAATGA